MSLVGTWELASSENWDEYMKELGVGMIMRKAASAIKSSLIISQDGNTWSIKVKSTLKSSETKFESGVEFAETSLDGRDCKSVITVESPAKFVHVQTDAKGFTTTVTRELVGDKLVATLVANSVTCVRTYSRSA